MRKSWAWMLTVLLVFVCVVAVADEASSEIEKTIDFVWHAVGLMLAGFVTKLLLKLAKKYGIEVNEKQKETLSGYVTDAVTYADEWARKKVKLDKLTVKSIEKFDKAVEKLSEKVPYLTEDKARDLIVSALPRVRALIESRLEK